MTDSEPVLTIMTDPPEHPRTMSFGTWLATEGGRKCPQCGRYAQPDDLGSLGGTLVDADGKWAGHISMYGHRRGTGCNVAKIEHSEVGNL